MASVVSLKSGERRVQFTGLDTKRRTLYLGTCSKGFAHKLASHVEFILASAAAGEALPVKTADFLTELATVYHDKLVAAGLVNPRQAVEPVTAVGIGAHAEAYLEKRADMKPASRLVLGHVVRNLKDHFGADRELNTITAGDADDFSRWLATGGRRRGKADKTITGLSPATIAKRLQWCSAIFRDAVRRKLLTDNPFAGLKQPKGSNSDRQEYVPAETIEKLIELTPDAEWKLLLALSRYLGLRTPSEPFSLKWDDIDWEGNRIKVRSPKTECHGKAFRMVPILPEVRPHLDRLYFDPSREGTVWVLDRLRSRGSVQAAERGFWANMNLRQHLLRLIDKAGLQPWPRLFHNLRASAQTDLANRFPIHVVCEWLGNTAGIAAEHYLQVTDAHFAAAVTPSEATHFPTHGAPESSGIGVQGRRGNEKAPVVTGAFSGSVAGAGFEPTTSRL